MKNFNEENQQFHGSTYVAMRDEDRLTGALKRIYDFLSANEGKWVSAPTLCEWAEVSENSYRNRLSDLRVYHGCKIESENIKQGLWKYRYIGQMTDQEHQDYVRDLYMKRCKAPGDREKFNQVLRFLFAFAADQSHNTKIKAGQAMNDWAMDFVNELRAR